MNALTWRQEAWKKIAGPWDVLVIGGGITGAGILRMATDLGLKALLVEYNDFAWGTSSRSGKLVHGGLRYLKQGQVNVTRHSVGERDRLLREAPGLVNVLEFLLPFYSGQGRLRASYRLGLGIYDLLAGRKTRRSCSPGELSGQVPVLASEGLRGGFGYQDAYTDDARLVLRLILEAVADGGEALNYAPVTGLLFDRSGRVSGAAVRDRVTGDTAEVEAKVVINATGAWADNLRGRIGRSPVIRPLRGSHLVFPAARFPLACGVSFLHPRDGRVLYVIPWEGVTLAGTTDLDGGSGLDEEPAIMPGEQDYLLSALRKMFPSLKLEENHIIASFTGVRPVVGSGKKDPSKESRDMLVMDENGLLTVTGGKLTTFRLMAIKALEAAGTRLAFNRKVLGTKRTYRENSFSFPEGDAGGSPGGYGRLAGRYGEKASQLLAESAEEDRLEIPGSVYLWAELKHAARHEMAVHLDDLLLRRLRLGLVLPQGGAGLLDRIGEIVRPAMGWDRDVWREECGRYLEIWRRACRPGGKGDERYSG